MFENAWVFYLAERGRGDEDEAGLGREKEGMEKVVQIMLCWKK